MGLSERVRMREGKLLSYRWCHDALLIEVPAGLLDAATPEQCVRATAEHEAGQRARAPRNALHLFTRTARPA